LSKVSPGVPLSVARMQIEYELFVSKSNDAVVCSWLPLIWKELSSAPAQLPVETSEKVAVAPASGSAAESVPTVVPGDWFSGTRDPESVMFVGGSLTSVIEIAKTFS